MVAEFFLPEYGWKLVLSDKRTSLSLAYDNDPIHYFDSAGRLLGMQIGEKHYRRGLDNRLMEKHRVSGERPRVRKDVPKNEAQRLIEAAYGKARFVANEVDAGRACGGHLLSDPETPFSDWGVVAKRLKPICDTTFAHLLRDRSEFQRVYAPIGILPPDQYMSIVVQATTGCSYNQCTFCDFYRSRRFAVKSNDEFRVHLRDIVLFFRASMALRKSVFLADGNAIMLPSKLLRERVKVMNEFFTFIPLEITDKRMRAAWRRKHPEAFDGWYGFVDGASALKKTGSDFRELRENHLRRVYVGLESGDDAVLRFIRKPVTRSQVIEAVRVIKEAGVNVGVIAMVGVGGDRFAQQHEEKTISAINAMGLGEGDIVYLSDFVNHPGLPYEQLAAERKICDLKYGDLCAQRQAIRAGFRWSDPNKAPQVALYDIREFVY
jgi:radical SAM superfamily enzyme YgiQ (UPF0313 family)